MSRLKFIFLPGYSNGLSQLPVTAFHGLTAIRADQKIAFLMLKRMAAADKSIQAVEFMHKAVFLQKVERPIHGGWLDGRNVVVQLIQNIISLDRVMTVSD
jgi:hypothetical protein